MVSAEELLEKVWDENTDPFTNVVRVTIMTLRRKLGEPAILDTVQGVGYRIEGATVVAIAEPAAGEGAEAAADATAGDTPQH